MIGELTLKGHGQDLARIGLGTHRVPVECDTFKVRDSEDAIVQGKAIRPIGIQGRNGELEMANVKLGNGKWKWEM